MKPPDASTDIEGRRRARRIGRRWWPIRIPCDTTSLFRRRKLQAAFSHSQLINGEFPSFAAECKPEPVRQQRSKHGAHLLNSSAISFREDLIKIGTYPGRAP